LIDQLEKLKDQIREQIQQATGFQLFGAFQSRQNASGVSAKPAMHGHFKTGHMGWPGT